jgi:hypothetical protein
LAANKRNKSVRWINELYRRRGTGFVSHIEEVDHDPQKTRTCSSSVIGGCMDRHPCFL